MVFDALTVDEVQGALDHVVDSLRSPQENLDEAQRAQLRSVTSIERYLRVERDLHQRLVTAVRDQLTVILDGVGTSEGRDWARRTAAVLDSAQLGEVVAELLDDLARRASHDGLINRIHAVLREAVERENVAMAEAPR